MKSLLSITILLLSFQVFAQNVEVEIISADFGIEDQNEQKSLCLTVVRVPESQNLLGIVEGIEDCFYARSVKRLNHNRLRIDFNHLKPIEHAELQKHLQSRDTQLRFYFSDGE